jgi:hypothetical protein
MPDNPNIGRRSQTRKEIRLTRVAPNTYRWSNGDWRVCVSQNSRRIVRIFPPKTPRSVLERYVQTLKMRSERERRWHVRVQR